MKKKDRKRANLKREGDEVRFGDVQFPVLHVPYDVYRKA